MFTFFRITYHITCTSPMNSNVYFFQENIPHNMQVTYECSFASQFSLSHIWIKDGQTFNEGKLKHASYLWSCQIIPVIEKHLSMVNRWPYTTYDMLHSTIRTNHALSRSPHGTLPTPYLLKETNYRCVCNYISHNSSVVSIMKNACNHYVNNTG
jgi:hypothetical protein